MISTHVLHKPHIDVARIVMKEAEEIKLSDDGRYVCLKYQYRCGVHCHATVSDEQATEIRQLEEIHKMRYVHSEIRDLNIVFSVQDKSQAWIIDFDLADKENAPYPDTYNPLHINERHKDARAGNKRKKDHDIYAFQVIHKRYM